MASEVDAAEASRRVDLRNLPLVTIDGEDAKDFDDAVYCEPHAKGFRLIVAIADVSYYVRRGTALDASARERGTSVYFPTRVIPDAAVRAVERVVLAAAERRSPVLRGGHDRLEDRRAAGIHVLSGGDALGRAAHLRQGFRRADRGQARGARGARQPHRQAAAAGGCLSRAAQGAAQARRARVRRCRSRVRHRRGGTHPARVPLRTQRGAQAHRGMHDPRERGGGARAGIAAHRHVVSRAWQARRKEAQPAARNAQRARRSPRSSRKR